MRLIAGLTLAACLAAAPALAQTLERIKETGELRLGFRIDAAPLSYLEAGETPAGYSPRVCAGVAERLAAQLGLPELNATFYPVDSTDRFDKVASGEIDLLCGAATITLARRQQVGFSIPTYVDGTAVMIPKDAEPGLANLAGKKIGVRSATTTEQSLRNSLENLSIDAEVVTFDDHMAGLSAMETSEIEAYFADQSILFDLFYSSDMAENFAVSDEILTIEKHGLALPRGDEDFRLAVDRSLSEMYATGVMEQIFVEAMPDVTPGAAMQALHIIAPTLP